MDFNKISSRFDGYRTLLINSIADETIKALVAEYGYDEAKLQEGIELYHETDNLFLTRETKLEYQVNSSLSFNMELSSAKDQFKKIMAIARRVFKPMPDGLSLLPVTSKITDFDLFKETVIDMYNGILNLPHLLSKLAKYGFTEEMFRGEIEAILSLEKLNNIQKVKNAELQHFTALRNAKLKELHEFCTTYMEIAKIALADKNQYLEKIGIPIPKKNSSSK